VLNPKERQLAIFRHVLAQSLMVVIKASAAGAGLESVPGASQRALDGEGTRGVAKQVEVLVDAGSATARPAKVERESMFLNSMMSMKTLVMMSKDRNWVEIDF
jgi:hypothetical protein